MKRIDSVLHVRGESHFVDDLGLTGEMLFAAVFPSPIAHGRIKHLSIQPAQTLPKVVAVLTAQDIPGENQIGNIIQDEPLLAEEELHYVGQPVALVVAESLTAARTALGHIELEITPLPRIFDVHEAYKQGQLITIPRTFSIGDVDAAWKDCEVIVEGGVESGAQEHVYHETQAALAMPQENDCLKVISATQSPSMTQRMLARVLDCPMHKIEVEVLRLRGAFGGKEEQATAWAVLAGLAASRLQKPIKLVLQRQEDMRMTGKRHPYISDFKMGLTREGMILAYEVKSYQNGGAVADLSPAILERMLFHITNSYFIPNVRATAYSCRTHLPPNTACRGFGAPQAMFVMESAIYRAAHVLRMEPAVIQHKNLLREGDMFPYGMRVQNSQAQRCWQTAMQFYEIEKQRERIKAFNVAHELEKKGLAMMPICFGISFTTNFLNQASALVHIYSDGSVSVSSGAVEMGQGVSAKIQEVAARTLSINPRRIKIETTNSIRIGNMSPTAASTGADMNGKATELACHNILTRLRAVAAQTLGVSEKDNIEFRKESVYLAGEKTEYGWQDLINTAYLDRISLSSQAHYATPDIYFDKTEEKGKPFAYHVFGTAAVEVTVDCLRGRYQIDTVKVVHDFGHSLDSLIDQGQVEGGVVQGLGWMTIEEVVHDDGGRLLSDTLTTYKVPDIYFTPEIEVYFLEKANNPQGLFNSKAIGEPPFMYGIGVYFALLEAMKAFRKDLEVTFSAPLTPEKVLMSLYRAWNID